MQTFVTFSQFLKKIYTMNTFLCSQGNFSPVTEATHAVNNLGKVYERIVIKLRESCKNNVRKQSTPTTTISHTTTSNFEPNKNNFEKKPSQNLNQDKEKLKKKQSKTKRKRIIRSSIKLKPTQPYQLRKLSETDGHKKIYGFGSFVVLPEKTEAQKQQLPKRPDWRTRAMLSRMMKQNSQITTVESVKSKTSTAVSRKSSFIQKRLQDKPPDETVALSYVQSKPKLFIPCRSASRSFNLSLNLQELHLKESSLKKKAREVYVEKNPECPAMHKSCSDIPIDREDMWGVSGVAARCTCFPGKYEKNPVLPPSGQKLKISKSQGVFVENFVDDLKKDWKSMSSNVGAVLSTQYLSKDEQIKHIKSLIPQLKTRELQLGEVEGVVKEIKKMKERLISLEMNNPTHRNTDGLKLVLKKIHSSL